ncbi:MAG: glycosyltransferase [Saprospiraceae bacterium]|nr:glycosyltransferase [Saprospiraceae bacterium]
MRPLLSVMIPSHNRADYLRLTLESVMQQFPSDGWIEVVVVDDASKHELPDDIVALYPSVSLVKNTHNLGQIANLNQCIDLAQGEWVHILHSDDIVLPGFYDAMHKAIRQYPEAGGFFCRHAIIDGTGNQKGLSELWRDTSGHIDNWLKKISIRQCIQTPSIVVQKAVYTQLGHFQSDLAGCEDWEMWHRISQYFPVIFIPEILCQYREFDHSNSGDAFRSGRYIFDLQKAIILLKKQHKREDWTQQSVSHYEKYILDTFFTLARNQHISMQQLMVWWKAWTTSIFFRWKKIPAMIKLSLWVLWPGMFQTQQSANTNGR